MLIGFDRTSGEILIDRHGRRITDVGLAALWLRWDAGTPPETRVAETLVIDNYTRGRDDGIPSAFG
ncbi:MAG: hypothetical protein IT338_17405 [Thermomicrobiales bacterium]|nr:hypothetical protein [Thermomicrobiales bacterium]